MCDNRIRSVPSGISIIPDSSVYPPASFPNHTLVYATGFCVRLSLMINLCCAFATIATRVRITNPSCFFGGKKEPFGL